MNNKLREITKGIFLGASLFAGIGLYANGLTYLSQRNSLKYNQELFCNHSCSKYQLAMLRIEAKVYKTENKDFLYNYLGNFGRSKAYEHHLKNLTKKK